VIEMFHFTFDGCTLFLRRDTLIFCSSDRRSIGGRGSTNAILCSRLLTPHLHILSASTTEGCVSIWFLQRVESVGVKGEGSETCRVQRCPLLSRKPLVGRYQCLNKCKLMKNTDDKFMRRNCNSNRCLIDAQAVVSYKMCE
jgi:hypothetical protein